MPSLGWLDTEMVYGRLPIPLQNAICSAEGRRLEWQRYGKGYQNVLADAEERAWSPEPLATAYRDSRLQVFVGHCSRTVPYYRRWFRDNRVDAADIRTLADLSALPVLTKADVQGNIADFQSDALPRRRRVATHTSGSTGAGLRFSTTVSAIREQYAVWWRYRHWHGLEHGVWCGHFGARSVVPTSQKVPPYWRYDRPGRRVMFSGYHMSESRLGAYVEELAQASPALAAWLSLDAGVAGGSCCGARRRPRLRRPLGYGRRRESPCGAGRSDGARVWRTTDSALRTRGGRCQHLGVRTWPAACRRGLRCRRVAAGPDWPRPSYRWLQLHELGNTAPALRHR